MDEFQFVFGVDCEGCDMSGLDLYIIGGPIAWTFRVGGKNGFTDFVSFPQEQFCHFLQGVDQGEGLI